MHYETLVDIDATPEQVWSVLSDVERWPEWTASVTRVQILDGELREGSVVRVEQPRMPTLKWKVVGLEPARSFFWTSKSAGVVTLAGHRLIAHEGNGVTVVLSILQAGLLAQVVELLAGRQTRRYVDTEAQGLKRRCEQQ